VEVKLLFLWWILKQKSFSPSSVTVDSLARFGAEARAGPGDQAEGIVATPVSKLAQALVVDITREIPVLQGSGGRGGGRA
jgi:hypothetical protein